MDRADSIPVVGKVPQFAEALQTPRHWMAVFHVLKMIPKLFAVQCSALHLKKMFAFLLSAEHFLLFSD